MQSEITFSWRTPFTHPQNSTGWNVEKVTGDPDRFDANDAEEIIRRRHPSMCGTDDSAAVQIGSITYRDDEGDQVTLQEPNL